MIKKRNPFIALLLSLIPGLGQIYNGQLTKGLIFFLFDLFIPIFFGLTGVLLTFRGLVIMLVVSIMFILYAMMDGFIVAKKLKQYELKKYNNWLSYYLYAMTVGAIGVFVDISTATGIQTFKIPSTSMNPTIQPGDRVVASLNYYGNNPIEQGDIVIFKSPEGEIWNFRVVALPNDSVEVKDGKVYINNTLSELTLIKEYILDDREVIQYQEYINERKTIKTLRFKKDLVSDAETFEKVKVPDNEYFLMGDNRDNALDSRFIGTIKKADILGRVIYSYWGNTSDRINIDFKKE